MVSPGRTVAVAALAAGLLLAGCVSRGPNAASPADAARYNMQLGISYLRQGNLPAAQEKLQKAIEQDPGLATAHAALGVVYERLDDPVGAERQYRRAVALDPSDPDSLNSLAVFLCAKKDQPAEALRIFDQALAIPLSRRQANRTMLNTNAGTCAKRVDPGRAEAYLRAAIAQDPQFADALLQLADVTLEQGNAFQARAFLQRYLAVARPPSAAGLWLGVRIERAMNDPAAARDYANRLKSEFPDSVETRLLLEDERSRG